MMLAGVKVGYDQQRHDDNRNACSTRITSVIVVGVCFLINTYAMVGKQERGDDMCALGHGSLAEAEPKVGQLVLEVGERSELEHKPPRPLHPCVDRIAFSLQCVASDPSET